MNNLSPDALCVDPSQHFEVMLRDVRDLLYHDGPLAINISTPHLRDTPCTTSGAGQPVPGRSVVAAGCHRSSALHRAGCQDPDHEGEPMDCKVAPEANGVCDKETRRCVPYSAKTHVYDFGKRPWLYPSLVKFLPRLQDVVTRMTLDDPRRRPSFSQVIRHVTCLRSLVNMVKPEPAKMRKIELCLKKALTYVENFDEAVERRTGHFGLRAHLAEPARNVSHWLGHGHPRLVGPKVDPLRRRATHEDEGRDGALRELGAAGR